MGAFRSFEVPKQFQRSAEHGYEESTRAALWLIDHMCQHVGIDDLSASDVLDFGCGVRFTQVLLDYSLPIKLYVGVDVYREMVEFLRAEVSDPRFEYFHLDAYNEMYNPDGALLTEDTELPLGDRRFDLICLFSVFTHLVPRDYRMMLKLLRRYATTDGRLFFTLFINELTDGGHGLMDSFARALGEAGPDVQEQIGEHLDAFAMRPIPDFIDLDPAHPLLWAVYSQRYARQLIEGTGWELLSVSPPDVFIQHHMVCKPC